MNNIVVKELTNQDYEGIRRVDILTQKQYLGKKQRKLSPAERNEHLVSRRSEFDINVNTGYSFVARLDNKIIGFIFGHETLPFRSHIYIRYIGINPKYQKQGIGLLLYQELIKRAKKNNIKKITALINLDNPNSMKLHEKSGFTLKNRKQADLFLQKTGN